MNDKGLTTMNLNKSTNQRFTNISIKKKVTSKQQIVQELQMGLSTVSQNLTLLENEGIIERNGYFASTGGRKAQAIRIVETFKLAIGIGILKNMFHITVVDLYEIPFFQIPSSSPTPTLFPTMRKLPEKSRN